ncbi:MAG: PAS domain-containing protein [Acidobacteria bacterium]|nr:PAS domain-containing protein [Acidobacteriota bacterium]
MAGPEQGLGLDSRRLFDEVPCYISIQNRESKVVGANRALREAFGDPIGKNCHAVYKGRPERCPECPVARTFEDGRDHSSQEVLFDSRGLPHDVIVRTRPLRDAEGAITAVMEMFSDITVQKELEHRLHDSLNRFHSLFDVAPCFISLQDRELRVVEANDNVRESFGNPAGRHCHEVYKKRSDPCPECPVLATFADGRMHTGEHVWVDNSGKEVLAVVQTAPIRDSRGAVADVMEVSTDITQVRALQDQLASLGKLVGGIAHSIKNILEGLRGGVYIVNLGFRDNNQEDIRTGWSMVERNVGRISSMVMDMLYCAKDRSPRRLPVSLSALAGEVVELFRQRAKDCRIRLETDLTGGDCVIAGEPKDIHSLVANLVTNAIDACCSEQNVKKSHAVVVRVRPDNGFAVLEVEDNGAGMDEEAHGKLFTTFFTTKGAYGTGLGLLVSHKVATEHGGTIAVRSAPGEGATFTVRLPLRNEETA